MLGEAGTPGNNGGIVLNDTHLSLSPPAMFISSNWKTREKGVLPTITIRDSQDKEIKVGDFTKDTEIKMEVTDGNYGSGIGLLKIKNSQKDFLKEIKDNYNISHIYSSDEIGKIPEGEIIVEVYDQAGNLATTGFKVDNTPPTSSVQSISPLYENFRGTTTLNPITLELTHNFEFTDEGSGISTVTITGPSGNLIDWFFEPPVVSTNASFENMEFGEYEIKVVDADKWVGNTAYL